MVKKVKVNISNEGYVPTLGKGPFTEKVIPYETYRMLTMLGGYNIDVVSNPDGPYEKELMYEREIVRDNGEVVTELVTPSPTQVRDSQKEVSEINAEEPETVHAGAEADTPVEVAAKEQVALTDEETEEVTAVDEPVADETVTDIEDKAVEDVVTTDPEEDQAEVVEVETEAGVVEISAEDFETFTNEETTNKQKKEILDKYEVSYNQTDNRNELYNRLGLEKDDYEG